MVMDGCVAFACHGSPLAMVRQQKLIVLSSHFQDLSCLIGRIRMLSSFAPRPPPRPAATTLEVLEGQPHTVMNYFGF